MELFIKFINLHLHFFMQLKLFKYRNNLYIFYYLSSGLMLNLSDYASLLNFFPANHKLNKFLFDFYYQNHLLISNW